MSKSYPPKFYTLGSVEKGKYLLNRGDKEREEMNIGNAISYYKQAIEYCPSHAQKRLDEICTFQSAEKVDPLLQQLMLTGPYFPTSLALATSFTPISSSATLSQESINHSAEDAPSTLALANMFIRANYEEKKPIDMMIEEIIKQFNESSSSKESIQELAVLASIPDQQIFTTIISQLLKVEKDSPTFPELTIYGLAVILTSAPKEIDLKERQGLFADILGRLQFRLEKTRIENNNEELLPLLRALSALFDAMLCRKMIHLGRLDAYNPINDRLTELASDDNVDPEVSFLAQYAMQSLAYIGNDESLSMSIYCHGRLAIGIIADIRSAVLSFDLEDFESMYEKILSMSDFSIKMEWYQGLLFLDCLLANEDFSGFEKFIIKSKLNSNEYFMQGVCLRLEQVASMHLDEHIILRAQKLLQDLESSSPRSVQATARMLINRLGITSSRSTSLLAIGLSTPQTQVSKVRLAPVWNKSWYSDDNSNLLKAVQQATKPGSNIHNLNKIIPIPTAMNEVNRALMDHYSSQLTIQRVSGRPLDLEYCYINLAIVEASTQRKRDEEELKKQQQKFIRMPSFEEVSSTNTEKPIPLEDILGKRKLLNGSEGVPKRILIIGRAGIGKTTLCKKLIHTFQQGQWKDQFDAVLWIPLRVLKGYRSRKLDDLLLEKYFFEGVEYARKRLAQEFMRSAEKGKVLFILDGLDEFVTDMDIEVGDPIQIFAKTLFKQHNVIITTRPYGNDRSLLHDLDLELEIVGFSSDNVEQYVKSVVKDFKDSNAILDFIQQTPLIQGLVNIPIQLDLICSSWEDLRSSNKSATITQIYQTIVRKLWCSDAIRMRKTVSGKIATENLFKNLPLYMIDSSMDPMVDFLGYLAFRGLKDGHQLVFDLETLKDTEEELNQHRLQLDQPELPMELLYEVMKSSILHKPDIEVTSHFNTPLETWNFIHLTFQEFFAARWLSKYFQSEQSASLKKSKLMDVDRTMAFIRQNKYNPRYEIVWWMLAGQLSGDALESYFQLLQGAPRDLIGARHQLLIAGCYKEACPQLSIDHSNQIQDELTQWLHFEMTFPDNEHDRSILGRQSVFPEEILIKRLNGSRNNDIKLLRALKYHKYLKSSSVEKLIQLTNTKDLEISRWAIYALGSQSRLTQPSATALVIALQDENEDVREAAANALGNQSTLSDFTTTALVTALHDKGWNVRIAAAKALGNQSTLSDSTTTALVTALQDENEDVREAAVNALGNQSTMSDSTATAFASALQDENEDVREAAADILETQSTLSDSATIALVTTLQHENKDVRSAAVNALGKQSTLSDSTTKALVTALQDEDVDVRRAAARALGNQSTLSDSTLELIVNSLSSTYTDQLIYTSLRAQRVIVSLKHLTIHQISMLYKRGLFDHCCSRHASLFIYENRLFCYTEYGYQMSDELSSEVLDKIKEAFIETQESGRIQFTPYE